MQLIRIFLALAASLQIRVTRIFTEPAHDDAKPPRSPPRRCAGAPSYRPWGGVRAGLGVDHAHPRRPAAGRGRRDPGGNQLARWFAVAVVGLNAIDMMFFVSAYPFWALTIIAVDVVALYGLCACGSRRNLEAV